MTTQIQKNIEFYNNKISEYKDKIKNGTITEVELNQARETVAQYYGYLEQQGIDYASKAISVSESTTGFGAYANELLRDALKEKAYSDSRIAKETAEIVVSLAFEDSALRKNDIDGNLDSRSIANYHYNIFENHGLPKEAWGGAVFEEFIGSGSWMEDDLAANGVKIAALSIKTLKDDIVSENGLSAKESVSRIIDFSSSVEGLSQWSENIFLNVASNIKSFFDSSLEFKDFVDPSQINNDSLTLTINTDKTQDFSPTENNQLGQDGLVIGDADWGALVPFINDDGYNNTVPGSIASDNYRPGNTELSLSQDFIDSLSFNVDNLQKLQRDIVDRNNNNGIQVPHIELSNPVADLTNQSIDARDFINIDPVILDLNNNDKIRMSL